MLEDDYMGMVTTTFMYSMRERVVMGELDKHIGVPANNGLIVNCYSPHSHPWISCTLKCFWSMMNMTLALTGMRDPKMNSSG